MLKNSREFVLIESINMAYTLFEAKKEAQLNQKKSETAYRELEAREHRLEHVNRVLLSIRKINQIITKETEVSALLDRACRVLIETSGYYKAWIVLTDNGIPQGPFFHCGFEDKFSPMEKLLKTGTVPQCAREAIKTEDVHIVTDPTTECPICPFKDKHVWDSCVKGERVTMTMPLIINETVYGWISVNLPSFFSNNADEHKLFREVAGDLTYALHNIKVEETKRLLARDLNLTQATLMTALDNSHAGIAIADAPSGKFRYVNDAALRIRGGKREEIVEGIGIDQYAASWNLMDLERNPLEPDEVPLARAIMYGETNSRQFIVRRNDTEDRIVTANAAPIYDEEGKINSAIVIFIDVTEHKETERKLLESEEKYKALYENAPLPYQSLDKDGNFIDVNPAWLTTLGFTREEVIGHKFADFLHPSWKPHFEKNFPAFKKRGYVHDVQFKIRRKSGEYRDITFEGCIGYKPDGSVRQTYCVFKDITDRKNAEKAIENEKIFLNTVIDNIKEAVIICNEKGEIIRFNESSRKLHNLPEEPIPADQWADYYDLYYTDGVTPLATEDIPLFRALNGEDVQNAEIVVHPKGGDPHFLSCNGSRLLDKKDNTIGAVIAMHDKTGYR